MGHARVALRWTLPLALGLGLTTSPAYADVTSWFALGGGYGFERNAVLRTDDRAAAFSATVGAGSSPLHDFVVGTVIRGVTHFGLGTDVSLGARLATGGFARGGWGLALDGGVAARFWRGGDYGQFPIQAVLTGGLPWGLQVGVGTDVWNLTGDPTARGVFAVLELDFLRLTLMRQGATERWWPNPAPAGGHMEPEK